MRTTRLLAALVAAALLLAGCGGSPKPSTLPSKSPTPSPSASPSPTPPVTPAAVRLKTKEGAEATVRLFLDTLAYAGASGQTDELRATYAASCTKCEAIAKGIDDTYGAGGSIRGGAWHPTQLKFYAIKGNVAYIDAVVDYGPQTWTRTSSASPQHAPAQKNVLKAFQLIWSSGRWSVGALDPQT
jgi:hypothetical protein